MNNKNKGFTLIEIIIVVTIIAAMVVSFSWQFTLRDRRITEASAQTLASALREARDRSSFYGVPVNFTVYEKHCIFSYEIPSSIPSPTPTLSSIKKTFPIPLKKVLSGNTTIALPYTLTVPPFGSLDKTYDFHFERGRYEVTVRLNRFSALVQVIKPQ